MSGLPHAYGDMPHEVSRQCLYSALAGSQALSLFLVGFPFIWFACCDGLAGTSPCSLDVARMRYAVREALY